MNVSHTVKCMRQYVRACIYHSKCLATMCQGTFHGKSEKHF